MTKPFVPPPPEALLLVRREAARILTPAEWDAYVRAPMTEGERAETASLVEWFTRRYPTPLERLQYVTRAMKRLARWPVAE